MKTVFFVASLFLGAVSMYAQDIEVKKFEQLEKDLTAVTSPRKDINGNACGLVKVALKEAGAEFEGNVMGNVQFTGSEYLVYLPNGTKRLGIKHPDYLPTTIVFADYGAKRVSSGTTYQLKVKTNKKKAKVDNSKKGMAVFNIKPSNAMLLIDGQIADGSGGAYTLSLPHGNHYYTVKIKDFSLNNQIVHIDKEVKTINVDLTEFFAKVDVSCKTTDAEITVNGEQKGIGSWSSMVAPGSYTIEASKDGCHSQTRFIQLRDNETARVDFTTLKTITGNLRVDYEPTGSDVLLNGKKVGVTPLELKELPIGEYQLEIWKEHYIKKFFIVKILEDEVQKTIGELKLTEFGRWIVMATEDVNNHDEYGKNYADLLAFYYRYGAGRGEMDHPVLCNGDSVQIPFNPVKAIYWYKKLAKEGFGLRSENAKSELGKDYPSVDDDVMLSLYWAKNAVEKFDKEHEEDKSSYPWWYYGCPHVALAWHYFYGVGCEKNLEEAKRLIKKVCNEKGEYKYPSLTNFIKDMGMDKELKCNPDLFYHDSDLYE